VVAGIIFFVQRNNVLNASYDTTRKTAINAMFYSLEEAYYPTHNGYPTTISPSVLPTVDPDLFTDPSGTAFGDPDSDYTYKGLNCSGDLCQAYTLTAKMTSEADYTKSSRHGGN